MKAKLLATAFAAAFAAGFAFADKVTLKSGSFLTGEAGDIQGDKLKFKSEDIGDVEIAVSAIEKLESSRGHVIQYKDLSRETKPVTVVGGAYSLDGKPLDMSNVKAIDPEEEKWHGSVNLSAAAARGNTVAESATLVGDVSRRWEHDRLTAGAGYFFAQSGDSKDDKQKTVSRFEAFAQEDHFWQPKLYSYVNGKYEFDRIMDLDYRWRVGVGAGYQWLENRDLGMGKLSFNQEVGLAYVGEKYEHESKDGFGAFRYAHHLAWTVAAVDGLDFVHNFEYLPAIDEWFDNYMIDTDAGITYAFRANWQLIAKVEWDYKSKVGDRTKHSDIRYILGLGYKW
ncbi:MAG: DUF481 domain-containing protein [Kiritimatiellae bacterium]|nr:DUF481 domain-containing protein [Kiritimatiellia bacterium]